MPVFDLIELDQVIGVLIFSEIGLSESIFVLILELKKSLVVLVDVGDGLFKLDEFFYDSF